MKINVTDSDIMCGIAADGGRCPVARALKRHLCERVAVGNSAAWIDDKEIPLDSVAIKFIARFDAALQVEPFSFELEVEGKP